MYTSIAHYIYDKMDPLFCVKFLNFNVAKWQVMFDREKSTKHTVMKQEYLSKGWWILNYHSFDV